jgi:hypothetical protein
MFNIFPAANQIERWEAARSGLHFKPVRFYIYCPKKKYNFIHEKIYLTNHKKCLKIKFIKSIFALV